MAPKQVAECLLTLVMNTLLVVSSLSWPLNRRSLKFVKEKTEKDFTLVSSQFIHQKRLRFSTPGILSLKSSFSRSLR
ncbi:hypothetical protein M0R45_034015 [Rubus argutus]|uniref:Uncharacterized protein n=1 Tax=Rubus argutus TaxID=59490 RepID=A0AAW1VS05_RUBAR